MKIIKLMFLLLFIVSISVNVRLVYLWQDSHNEVYDQMTDRYFSDQKVLAKLRDEKYNEGIELLEEYSNTNGDLIAIICIENGCEIVE